MLRVIRARIEQKYRTMRFPSGPAPELPDRFAGRPVIAGPCPDNCRACRDACPTGAIGQGPDRALALDMGRCLFCRDCVSACPEKRISFSRSPRLAASRREDLVVGAGPGLPPEVASALARKLFRRSLKLRQVSAAGCNSCEADVNVLGTPAWDMGRFGIQFVASPRHADGILVTGPVSENMALALQKTYEAVPEPRIVIACGACAISGGPYIGHPEAKDGAGSLVPVDLYVPGCPPHPLTTLDALLRFLGRSVPEL
ncbi:MAG: 4Fe-4S dicluster domain-containing protein [Thermodesulfobacteriota bacterium]